MFTKQFRFNLVQLVFNFVFRKENELGYSIDDIILPTTTSEEKVTLEEIVSNFSNLKERITPFLLEYGWDRTPFLSRAILLTFLEEVNLSDTEQKSKIIADYLHLTQDLSGADSVSLVHAVIGKMVPDIAKE